MINGLIKIAIFEHAKQEYPNECVGVVVQRGKNQEAIPLVNVADNKEKFFEVDPDAWLSVIDNHDVIAVYHSHCGDGAKARPSAADICACNEVEIPYVIVSLPEGDMTITQPATMPLIGRPWSLGFYDCYGLVMAFHKEHGIALGDYRKPYEWWQPEHGMNLYDENWQREGFIDVSHREPIYGDLILMKLKSPVTNHAGIYLGNNQMLHHYQNRLSKRDLYSGYWKENTVRICRHKDLEDNVNAKVESH